MPRTSPAPVPLLAFVAVDDSMAPTVNAGDTVICDPTAMVKSGDVVMVGNQSTVICGRFHLATIAGAEAMELRFDNPTARPVRLPMASVRFVHRAESVTVPIQLP